MGKIRILAIEDNQLHASRIEFILDELGYELISIAKNANEALRVFRATIPDLVLMDIDLSDNRDGIEVAESINKINPVPIIFTTAFTDKETFDRAKTTEPYAYMIKPVEKSALQASIELAVFRFSKDYIKETMEESGFSGWTDNMLATDCFFVKTVSCLEKVKYENVLWISVASDRYCEIITADKSYKIRASLKNLIEKLPPQFLRIHRTHIANIEKVDRINEQEMTLTIADHTIPMAQASKQMIIQKFTVL